MLRVVHLRHRLPVIASLVEEVLLELCGGLRIRVDLGKDEWPQVWRSNDHLSLSIDIIVIFHIHLLIITLLRIVLTVVRILLVMHATTR